MFFEFLLHLFSGLLVLGLSFAVVASVLVTIISVIIDNIKEILCSEAH